MKMSAGHLMTVRQFGSVMILSKYDQEIEKYRNNKLNLWTNLKTTGFGKKVEKFIENITD